MNETSPVDGSKEEQFHWPAPFVENFDESWPNLDESVDDLFVEKWILENNKVLMRVVTWNLAANPPPSIDDVTLNLLPKNRFHIYMVGSEECERSIAKSAINTSKKNWETYLRNAIGLQYIPIRSHTLQATHLIAFVHKSIAHFCTAITSAAVACGTGNTLGNKGGVSIHMKLGNRTILVTNAHLAAHQNAEKQRNADFKKINRQMPSLLAQKKEEARRASTKTPFSLSSRSASSPNIKNLSSSTTSDRRASAALVQTRSSNNLGVVAAKESDEPDKPHVMKPPKLEPMTDPWTTYPRFKSGMAIVIEDATLIDDEDKEEAKQDISQCQALPCSSSSSDLPAETRGASQSAADPTEPTIELDGAKELKQSKEKEKKQEQELPGPNYVSEFDDNLPGPNSMSASAVVTTAIKASLDTVADCVVFMGDLNYRINGNRTIIDHLLEANMQEVLLTNDQLTWNMQQKEVLEGFVEPPLRFRPTYKLDVDSDKYQSTGKQRLPAWCDRVLYVPRSYDPSLQMLTRVSANRGDEDPSSQTQAVGTERRGCSTVTTDGANMVECVAYHADFTLTTSDHRPVYASFVIHGVDLYDSAKRVISILKKKLSSTSQKADSDPSSSTSDTAPMNKQINLNASNHGSATISTAQDSSNTADVDGAHPTEGDNYHATHEQEHEHEHEHAAQYYDRVHPEFTSESEVCTTM